MTVVLQGPFWPSWESMAPLGYRIQDNLLLLRTSWPHTYNTTMFEALVYDVMQDSYRQQNDKRGVSSLCSDMVAHI